MIKLSLKCAEDHQFDSWFQSTEAFGKLKGAGLVTCAICGSDKVDKAIMAPRIRDSRSKAVKPASGELSTPANPAEQAIAELKRQIEQNSEYVGLNFAAEARDMYEGTTPARSIYGEAKPDEARKLIEDGVPVTPLPFRSGQKSN
ncbi:hypothetical protein PEL8287_02509 [Roseovarius litorisediminis]|uniref:DUF1178 family protein n=1 Tax=Roseovarius litorisediminis TaxID=1312363 RepID=A0A1Y5STU6_9RHOB|nr:DUF1178 family protein [Roseovarius litorisediminis]SLN48408.1 hypothetical protein PEL8287_02509 [Roseovarius litorisediminis]